jgi:hypothetical protein
MTSKEEGMTNETIDPEGLESEEPVEDIICYECMQTKFSACVYLDGECPLDLF